MIRDLFSILGAILIGIPSILIGASMVISFLYLLLSPFLTFGMYAKEIWKAKFPKKKMVIVCAFLVLVGGTFVFDVMDKQGSYTEFKHLASKLNINKDTNEVTFDEYDLRDIPNLNRFEKSIKDVYLAGLKYPLSNGQGRNEIHRMVEDSYCDSIFYKLDGNKETHYLGTPFSEGVCNFVGESYEKLFFPLFYEGDFEDDRQHAAKVYAYVFDKSLQNELAEEIYNLKNRSIFGALSFANNRRSTEAGTLYEFQKNVHLDEVNYEVDYNSELGVYTNLATFTFQNTQRAQQEVFIEFTLPNENAVITDLKLGMDLELASRVAPRGAAKEVYEQSRRRSIDPALLKQVGPRQYQLRVFPIPTAKPWRSEDINENTGKQKVQFEFTAITQNDLLQVAPKLKVRNLIIDNNTKAEYVVRDKNGDIVYEEVGIYHSNLVQGKTLVKESPESEIQKLVKVGEDSYATFLRAVNTPEKADMVFFLDNSASVDKEKIKDIYEKLEETCEGACSFLTFNFAVKQFQTHDTLKFWGASNKSNLVSFLTNSSYLAPKDIITERVIFYDSFCPSPYSETCKEMWDTYFNDKEIFIITDDSDFEINPAENIDINYANAPKDTNYHVLVLGDHLPAMKHDLTKLLATGKSVDVQLLSKDVDVEDVLLPRLTKEREYIQFKEIFIPDTAKDISALNDLITEPKWREAMEDLYAYHKSREVISMISDEESWMAAGKKQTEIAARAHIVNQFNSLIALENEWQQKRLDKLKEGDDKYKSDHDMGEIDESVIFEDRLPARNHKCI